MSAWIVHKKHIQYMIEAALLLNPDGGPLRWFTYGSKDEEPNELGCLIRDDPELPSKVGQMLWEECHRSVNYCYRYRNIPSECPVYVHTSHSSLDPLDALQVLNAIHCYEYQSCEHLGWYESEARAFCAALKDLAICKLPGYSEKRWGID